MIYGYIRVSTDKQTVENQRFEINKFCSKQNLVINGWIEETISGTKNYNKRKLGELLKVVKKDDLIICAELSRLGRNLFMIMEILNICMNKECKVWTIKDNYRLGDDIQSKVLAFAFGLSAEIERNLISQRTKEALALKKAAGVHIGRIKGSHNSYTKLTGKEEYIKKRLAKGCSKTQLAKELNVNRSTIYRFLNDWNNGTDDCNGFDIVIGNPPYGAKVSVSEKKYFKTHYKCAETDNKLGLKGSTDTFTVFIEMGHDILATGGNLAFIVPMSVTSSDAMISLHKKIESDCSEIRVSSYSNRPQQIFDAACVRTSIIMLKKDGNKLEHLYTTKLIRRNKNTTIKDLIDNLEFIDSVNLKTPGRYAKIGTIMEAATLKKCFSHGKNVGSYINKNGKPFFYRSAGGRYWNVVANYSTTESSSEKSMYVNFTNLIGMFLSSSVFYFYQQIYTDGLNLKQSEIENFPLPDFNTIPKDKIKNLDKLYDEYLIDIEKNANVRTSSDTSTYNVSTFKEYKIVKSYEIVKKIDNEVCKLYRLSPEETEFIKNYELEARMVGTE